MTSEASVYLKKLESDPSLGATNIVNLMILEARKKGKERTFSQMSDSKLCDALNTQFGIWGEVVILAKRKGWEFDLDLFQERLKTTLPEVFERWDHSNMVS